MLSGARLTGRLRRSVAAQIGEGLAVSVASLGLGLMSWAPSSTPGGADVRMNHLAPGGTMSPSFQRRPSSLQRSFIGNAFSTIMHQSA